ncbi:MAG: hypothetical protein OXR67_06385 [Chloroflexota bacterium]|nr:hypothetical protein [Chloroflexota bacterium]
MYTWEANENSTDSEFEDLAYTMVNILGQIRAIEANRNNLVGASRLISVELRKLLLGDGLRRCVRRPMLHKLMRPDRLGGDLYEQVIVMRDGTITITKLDEPMAGQQAVIDMSPVKYETAVYPLYALRFEKGRGLWVSESPFDERLIPLRLDRWLKQPVLQINRNRHDMKAILSEVANTQGAHSDRRNDTIRQQINERFRDVYLNIFVLTVGIYLQNLFANSLATGGSLKSRVASVYSKIEEDAQYGVKASMVLSEDQLAAHVGWTTITLQSVAQDQPLTSGLPATGTVPAITEPIIHKTTIRVPSS